MRTTENLTTIDLAIIGAGAAGLATAAFASRRLPGRNIITLDSMARLGAKILVSGGGRCNLTNRQVAAADFNGGSLHTIRRVLASFPVQQTVSFFRHLGVDVHEETGGKLFPDSNRSKSVLDALLRETRRTGVRIITGAPVIALEKTAAGFRIRTTAAELLARCVVLATGGLSLPKTGSTGSGYTLATAFGHSLVPTTPALVPLVVEGTFHSALSGISHEAEIVVSTQGSRPQRIRGELLWTHFGISGPAALNASRHWHRARLEKKTVRIAANLMPGQSFESVEAQLLATSAPRRALHNALSDRLPARLADAVLAQLEIGRGVPLAQLPRDLRRRLLHALLNWPLPVVGSRGYEYAEITAGGLPLSEIDPATMESRKCRGLFLAGEILDVDGPIGGFNFQWAWSSAWVASSGVARALNP